MTNINLSQKYSALNPIFIWQQIINEHVKYGLSSHKTPNSKFTNTRLCLAHNRTVVRGNPCSDPGPSWSSEDQEDEDDRSAGCRCNTPAAAPRRVLVTSRLRQTCETHTSSVSRGSLRHRKSQTRHTNLRPPTRGSLKIHALCPGTF